MILSEGVSLKTSFTIFVDIIKFSESKEKMFNGERFITGYTKRKLIISA